LEDIEEDLARQDNNFAFLKDGIPPRRIKIVHIHGPTDRLGPDIAVVDNVGMLLKDQWHLVDHKERYPSLSATSTGTQNHMLDVFLETPTPS